MAGCGIVQDRRHRYLLASAAWDKGIAPAVPEVLLVDGIRWGAVGPLLFISLVCMVCVGAANIAVLTAMIIAISALWLVAATSLAPLLRDPGRARVVNAALAVALVGATALAVLH